MSDARETENCKPIIKCFKQNKTVLHLLIRSKTGDFRISLRAVIDIADIDISIKMSCDIDIDIENADINISEFGVTPVVELASLTRKT